MNVGNIQSLMSTNLPSTLPQGMTLDGDKSGSFASLINQLLSGGDTSQVSTLLSDSGTLTAQDTQVSTLIAQLLSGSNTMEQSVDLLTMADPTIGKSTIASIKELLSGKDTTTQKELLKVLAALISEKDKKFGNNELSTVLAVAGMMLGQDYSTDEVIKTVSALDSEQVSRMAQIMGVEIPKPDTTQQPTTTPIAPTGSTTSRPATQQTNLADFVSDMKQTGGYIREMLGELKAEMQMSGNLSSDNSSRLETLRNVFAFRTGTNLSGGNLNIQQPAEIAPAEQETVQPPSQPIYTLPPIQGAEHLDPNATTGFTADQAQSAAAQVVTKTFEHLASQTDTEANGVKQLTMQLNPDNLGKITVKLIIDSGRMNVNIFTESVIAQKMLESKLGYLQDGMRTNVVPVDNVSVVHSPNEAMAFSSGFYQDAQQNAQQQYQQQQFSRMAYRSGLTEGQGPEQTAQQETAPVREGYYI